jgi:hypothetical protein
MMPTCALCGARKAKRACPGVARDICPACCGTKRLVEIACPSVCPYLSAARTHPAAVVQRQQDRDLRFLLPRIHDLSEAQYRVFLFVQAVVLQHARQAVPAPLDADVADAAATVAATLETAGKGIIYAHHATTIPAERLAAEITRAIADVARRAGADAGQVERDTAMALRRLEGVARDAQAEVPDQSQAGPASSWIALATRVTGAAAAAQGPQPEADKPRIVL